MLAMLDLTSEMESVLHQLSTAQVDNTDTTVSAIATAQLEPASKVISVKELVLLEHWRSTTDATEHAQPNSQLLMLALIHAPPVLHLSMVYAKLVHKLAHQANSGMELPHHAKTVNILAHNVHSLLHTVPLVLLA